MPRRWGARPVTSTPSNRTRPALARMKPVMNPSVVVLPQPDGPTRATSSPWPTVRFSPCTAATWPYSTVSPSMSSFMADSRWDRCASPTSSPDRPAQAADADEPALQDREDGKHRDQRNEAPGRQQRPVDSVADLLDIALEGDGVGLGVGLRDEGQRQGEGVPAIDEGQRRDDEDPGDGERQDDLPQPQERARAIDHRCLLEADRNLPERPGHEPDAERRRPGSVGEDHPLSRSEQPGGREEDEEGHDPRRRWQEAERQDHDQQGLAGLHVVASEGVSTQR